MGCVSSANREGGVSSKTCFDCASTAALNESHLPRLQTWVREDHANWRRILEQKRTMNIGCVSPMLWCSARSVASKIRKLWLIGKCKCNRPESEHRNMVLPSLHRVSKIRVRLMRKIQVPRCFFFFWVWYWEDTGIEMPIMSTFLIFWFFQFLMFEPGAKKPSFPKALVTLKILEVYTWAKEDHACWTCVTVS